MSDAANSEARLESILDQVRELKDEYGKQAKATGENFNVFSILDRERKEVTTHSAIIAELLKPQGSHSQGTLFLKLFLKQLEPTILNSSSESSWRLKSFLEQLKPTIDASNELTGFEVRTEVFVPQEKEKGFLDIVIEADDAYIAIENKIDTEDAIGQLEKYCKHIEKIGKQTKVLLYLTPEGKKPNNLKLCGKEPVYQPCINKIRLEEVELMCLSYEGFIVKWLDNCIKEVDRISQIKETLHQYQMTVKKLTGHPINRRYAMALKNILLKNGNYNLIPELETAISEVKDAFQHEFWKELKGRLIEEQLTNKNLKFQLYGPNMEVKEISDKEFSDKELGIHIGRNPLISPGLTFSIPDGLLVLGDEKYEVAFRVEYETTSKYYFIVYGFVLCTEDKSQRVEIKKYKEALTRKGYMRLENQHGEGKDNGWISWNYFRYEHKLASFITESKETLIKLIPAIKSALETRENNKA